MKSKRILAMCICFIMLFTGIQTTYTYGQSSRPPVSKIVQKTVNLIGSIANSDDKDIQDLYEIIMMAVKEEVNENTGKQWNSEALVDFLKELLDTSSGQSYVDKLNEELDAEDEITIADAIKLTELIKLMDIFSKSERIQMIEDMKAYNVPELIKGDESENLVAKIREDLPELESKLESQSDESDSNFDFELYVYALTVVKNKIGEPVVREDADGNAYIYIPDTINGIDVKGTMDSALEGLSLWGYEYTTLDQFSNDFVVVMNEKITEDERRALKVILGDFDLYGDMIKPVIKLNGDKTITIRQGETYTDPVTAKDNVDGDITSKIAKTIKKDNELVTGLDTNVAGTYTIKYNVADKAGNEADELTRTVIVIKLVEIDENDIKEDITPEGTTEMTAEIPYLEIQDGKTEKAFVTVPILESVKQDLGISGDEKIEIELPPLNIGSGEKVTIKIKKAPEKIDDGKKVIAIAIEISGLSHDDKVELVLPIPQGVSADKAGAFHRENNRWAYREATLSGGQLKFETNLSSVAIAEKVEVPTLTEKSKTTNNVTLEWTSSLTGATYEVYRDGSYVATTNNKAYTVMGLNSSTTYNFTVRALDTDMFESDFSNTVTVTTDKSSSGGGGGGSYSGTTVRANQSDRVSRSGAVIQIPANAFGEEMKVKIETVYKTDKLPMEENIKLISEVFEITKNKEGNFKKAVTITLPFDKSKVDLEKYDLAIYWLDETKGEWIILDNVKIDSKDGKVSGEVNHFTKFAILAKEKAITPETVVSEKIVLPTDVVGHWAEKSIEKLIGLKAISGYPDGTFKPDNKITRAEFATVVVKAFDLKAQTGTVFADTKDHWAKDYIAIATTHGIASGYNENTFGPDDLITREQMAVIVVKASVVSEEMSETTFADSEQISDWAQKYVATAVKEKIAGGYPDNTFKPKANATRAEAMAIIANALK